MNIFKFGEARLSTEAQINRDFREESPRLLSGYLSLSKAAVP
jgi:hypothetical protein